MEREKLKEVVESLGFDPSPSELRDLKEWAADKAAFVFVDMDTQTVLYATPGAEEVFGYMPDEMRGLPLLALIPEGRKEDHTGYVEGFNHNPTDRSMGKRHSHLSGRRRDGSEFPAEIGLFPRAWKGRRICLANVVRVVKQD